ncbi:hypothetical protein GGI24_002721, partial [Coemansia furcata]
MGDLALNKTIYAPPTSAHTLQLGDVVEIILDRLTILDHTMHQHAYTVHCQMDVHFAMGLAITFLEAPN